jgi:hypothetical protein
MLKLLTPNGAASLLIGITSWLVAAIPSPSTVAVFTGSPETPASGSTPISSEIPSLLTPSSRPVAVQVTVTDVFEQFTVMPLTPGTSFASTLVTRKPAGSASVIVNSPPPVLCAPVFVTRVSMNPPVTSERFVGSEIERIVNDGCGLVTAEAALAIVAIITRAMVTRATMTRARCEPLASARIFAGRANIYLPSLRDGDLELEWWSRP